MYIQQSPLKNVMETKDSALHQEWLAALMALAPFTRQDALDLVMERMADAIEVELLKPIEPVATTDTQGLLKAQGQSDLLEKQRDMLHVFTLCENE